MLIKMLVCAKIVMQSCNCYSCTLYLEKWKNFDLKKNLKLPYNDTTKNIHETIKNRHNKKAPK